MNSEQHIVGICGSLSEDSVSRQALEIVLAQIEETGARTTLVDLRGYEIELVNPEAQPTEDVNSIISTIRNADALILATPVYHGSYSSPLKTVIDYCRFEEFEGKPVGLIAVAGGSSSFMPALDHLRRVMTSLRAWVIPVELGVPNSSSSLGEDGLFIEDRLNERARNLAAMLIGTIQESPSSSKIIAK